MDEKEFKNQIPCVIDNGILYNKKDMLRILRDIGHTRYIEFNDGEIKNSGEGYIVSVVMNSYNGNIIANKRIYLNVNGFDYLKLSKEDGYVNFDLVNDPIVLRLIPLTDPLIEYSMENNTQNHMNRFENEYEICDYAEINLDDEEEGID